MENKNKIKFLKKGIRCNGQYIPVIYSKSDLRGYPQGTITIYCRTYRDSLPAELNPKNDSDSMTDYFEKDRARITPDSPFYSDVLKVAA